MKNKIFLSILVPLFFILTFNFSFAQFEISVSPKVIKTKTKPRDLLEYSIKIKNEGKTLYHFYTLVKDIEGEEKENSLAKWVEIFRGRVEILGEEEKEFPLSIKIPFNAKPGHYLSEIIFAQGSTVTDAQMNALKFNLPKVLLDIEVEEESIEKLQIKKFKTDKGFYFNRKIKFILELENIGNQEVWPKSSIYVYDKNGKEIGTLELKESSLLPKEKKSFEVEWECPKSIGQFKGVVFGEYGKKNDKTFQDSVYFGIFSWKLLIFLILFCLIFLNLLILIFSKMLTKKYSISRKKR